MFLYLYSIKKRYEMAGKKKTYRIKRLSEKEFKNSFGTEEQCIEAFEKLRWGENIQSPFTGSYNVARRKKPGTYRDRTIERNFSIKTGTFMEKSNLPLSLWFKAVYYYCIETNGISSYKLAELVGVTQATAWFMHARIDTCIEQPDSFLLTEEISADECYIGGIDKWRHSKEKEYMNLGTKTDYKSAVVGLWKNDGSFVWAKIVSDVTSEMVAEEVAPKLAKGCKLYTDETDIYNILTNDLHLTKVCHSEGIFSIDGCSSNGIEGFWHHLKREISGTYISVSEYHLQRYIDEKVFQQNTRKMNRIDKIYALLSNLGRPLTLDNLRQPGRKGKEIVVDGRIIMRKPCGRMRRQIM